MKKNILFSLAAVALLASCNTNSVRQIDGLKICNELVCKQVAQNIVNEQTAAINKSEKAIALYGDLLNVMPAKTTKLKSIIDVTENIVGSYNGRTDTKVTVHKVCNLDLEKMCYTCDYQATETTDVGITTKYNWKYYIFFVLDEKQDKDITIDQYKGTIYHLIDDGTKHLRSKSPNFTLSEFYSGSIYYGAIRNENSYSCSYDYVKDSEIGIRHGATHYNVDSNPFYQIELLNWIYTPHDFKIEEETVQIDNLEFWALEHAAALALDDNKNNYFNPTYASNGPQSLAINLEQHMQGDINIEGTGGQKLTGFSESGFKKFVKFQDLYVTEAEFVTHEFADTKINNQPFANYTYDFSMKRTNIFGVADCSIPNDIDQYV